MAEQENTSGRQSRAAANAAARSSSTGSNDPAADAAQDGVAEQLRGSEVRGAAGAVTAPSDAGGPMPDGKSSTHDLLTGEATPEDAAARDAITTTGLTADGTPVFVAEDDMPELRGEPMGYGPLSWRPRPGDTLYVKLDEDDAGRPVVAPAVITANRGQLPKSMPGWCVDVNVHGSGGATDSVEKLALFGGPEDAKKADPQGPHGWIRRDA